MIVLPAEDMEARRHKMDLEVGGAARE